MTTIQSKMPKITTYKLKRKQGMSLGKKTTYKLYTHIRQLICNINIKSDDYKTVTLFNINTWRLT